MYKLSAGFIGRAMDFFCRHSEQRAQCGALILVLADVAARFDAWFSTKLGSALCLNLFSEWCKDDAVAIRGVASKRLSEIRWAQFLTLFPKLP
jgi:hypothetical protein